VLFIECSTLERRETSKPSLSQASKLQSFLFLFLLPLINLPHPALVFFLLLHSMDVHDLAWAPDNSLLVSCSVDNSILIWRVPILTSSGASYLAGAPHSSSSYAPSSPSGFGAGAGAGAGQPPPLLLSPERRLSRHSSWVKGLAWDPMGTYLASAAEDKTVCNKACLFI